MKIGAGILGISLGLSSLFYVTLIGATLGNSAQYFGGFGPSGNAISGWGHQILLLSFACSALALAGGVITFSKPMAGAFMLAGSAGLHLMLLGTGTLGQVFGGSIGLAALLAFFAATQGATATEQGNLDGAHIRDEADPSPLEETYDHAKWAALIKYDDDVARAAAQLENHDAKWRDELAASYLTLNDTKYLPDILARILKEAEAKAAEIEMERVRQNERLEAHYEEQRRTQRLRAEKLEEWKNLGIHIGKTALTEARKVLKRLRQVLGTKNGQYSAATIIAVALIYFSFPFPREIQFSASPPDIPDNEIVAPDACPFEGCQLGSWTARQNIPVYYSPTNPILIASINPGEVAFAKSGEIRAVPHEEVVTNVYQSDIANGINIGDVVYVLFPMGEGTFAIWHDGTISQGSMDIRFATPVNYASLHWTWWVHLQLPDGSSGWVKNPQGHFSGMDRFG